MYEELRQAQAQLTGPGGPFEITEIELRGVPIRTYKSGPGSLRDVWLGSAAHGDNDYLVYQDERWTFDEAHRDTGSISAWLAAQGVRPGDRVAIAMRNYPEWMLAYWSIVAMGASAVGMNAWWTGPEMQYGLEDSAPKILICDQERFDTFSNIRSHFPDLPVVVVRPGEAAGSDTVAWSDVLAHGGEIPEIDIDPDSDASVFYTSGTTGNPKGAQLTHRGCVNNIMSLGYWSTAVAVAGSLANPDKVAAPTGPTYTFAALVCTPLFHVTANNCVAHGATVSGGKLIHMYKWDAGEALALIEREHITNISGVPVMARELITHPDFAKYDTSSLKAVGGGGAQLQPDLVSKIESTVKTARPGTGYGMTETCGIITANANEFFLDKPDSAGPAMPVYEAKCVDDEGKDVGVDNVGELWVRGGQVIRGYLNKPEATAESITDGWLHTGDIARIDQDGFIFIVDRAKDMVLRGGENVYCAEVEAAIFANEAVAECSAFGVPDDRLGEEVGIAVVLQPGADFDADALRAHCAERIAKYKIPRYVWFSSEPLPRNASGKFLKRQLRDELDIADAS